MQRIYIVGGPGSGKTTLGRKVSAAISSPLYELDIIGYENGAGARRLLSTKEKEVHAIAECESWVAEGIFLWWTEELPARAEVIVWLDILWRTAAWRIVSRHMKARIAGTNKHGGIHKLWFFLREAKRYYMESGKLPEAADDDGAVTRAATEEVLAQHGNKVIRCRTNAEISGFLRLLER